MTIQTFSPFDGGIIPYMPGMGSVLNSTITAATTTMQTVMTFDAGTDRLGIIHMVPKTGTLTGIDFRTGTVSTAGATFQMQVETVDTSGLPSGTPYVANANGTVVVGTGDDNVWKQVAINTGTGVSVTRGDLVATVLSVSSGTPNTVIISGGPNTIFGAVGFPYMAQDTAGSWGKVTTNIALPFVWNYGGTYVPCQGMQVVNAVAATNIGNGNERALRFSVPYTFSCAGFVAALANVTAGADYRGLLCDTAGTTLKASLSGGVIDGDVYNGTTTDSFGIFLFDTSQTISANTEYFASVLQNTANNLAVIDFSVSAAGYMAAVPGGAQFYLGTRSGGSGAYSTTTTTRPLIFLIPDGFSDTASGGGGGGQRVIGS